MPPRRLHVVKVPTIIDNLFPYSHYSDVDHNPMLSVSLLGDQVILTCNDLFKLKPNVQQNRKIRIDIYMPGFAGFELGNDILALVGIGNIAELAPVDPEAFRVGPQTLPLIDETRRVRHQLTEMRIAGCLIQGNPGPIYIDRERPNEGHIEMVGPEIHLGIPLTNVRGTIDITQTRNYHVPENELRVRGEVNPIKKALGSLDIFLNVNEAQNLAATLIYYSQR